MNDTMPNLDTRIRELGLHIAVSAGKRTRDEEGWEHDAYRVRLTRRPFPAMKPMTLTYRKGTGHHGSPPTINEVLTAVILDAQGQEDADTFEEWAANYGYDTDSRKGEKIYVACVRQSSDFKKMVGPEAYDTLLNDTELDD